jgi:hypothetical protein
MLQQPLFQIFVFEFEFVKYDQFYQLIVSIIIILIHSLGFIRSKIRIK